MRDVSYGEPPFLHIALTDPAWHIATLERPDDMRLVLCAGERGGLFLGRRCAVDFTGPTERPEYYSPGRRRRSPVVAWMDVPAAPSTDLVDDASFAASADDDKGVGESNS